MLWAVASFNVEPFFNYTAFDEEYTYNHFVLAEVEVFHGDKDFACAVGADMSERTNSAFIDIIRLRGDFGLSLVEMITLGEKDWHHFKTIFGAKND